MNNERSASIEMSSTEFMQAGHQLVDQVAGLLERIREMPVTTDKSAQELQQLLGNAPLPQFGMNVQSVLARASDLLLKHSLLNGHPKFMGYITSSAAPVGALADLLAAAVNPNVGANILSPMATEIEKQTIRWLAEFIGVPTTYGGLLVSGGNMANFTALLAARTIKGPKNIKEDGMGATSGPLTVYCAKTTHTWIDKAMVLFGFGTRALRWIPVDARLQMDIDALKNSIDADKASGCKPIMVVGTAGDVSTGAVDDLKKIAAVCKAHDMWFHVDGAYGMPAAVLPELKNLFEGIEEADSIALDPHKWLYSPLEAGCTLVKNPNHLIETYSSHPVYYNFGNSEEPSNQNYYEYGFQNSRGFRALKVWIALQQAGRHGYAQMIAEDIALSKLFFRLAKDHPELEAVTQNLSITTLRYVPVNYNNDLGRTEDYLNKLNQTLLNVLQQGGRLFLSNAVVAEKYCLRGCIVNFRTTEKDIHEIIEIIVAEGRRIHESLVQIV